MENSSIDTAKYVRGEHMKKSLKIILIMLRRIDRNYGKDKKTHFGGASDARPG